MSFTSTKKFPSCFKFHPACHWLCQIQYLNLCVHYSGGNTNTDWEPRRQANLSESGVEGEEETKDCAESKGTMWASLAEKVCQAQK